MYHRLHSLDPSVKELLRLVCEGDMLFFVDDPGGGGGGDPDPAPGGDPDPAKGAPGGDPDDPDAPGGDPDDKETLTPEAARKLRSESKNLRDRLKKAETDQAALKKQLDDIASKDLSDKDRLEKDLKAKKDEAAAQEARLRTLSVQVAAGKAGVLPQATEAAAKLVDWDSIDDPSDEKQVVRAIKDLKPDHAYLFGSNDIDAGAGKGDKGGKGEVVVTPGLGRLTQAYETSSKT